MSGRAPAYGSTGYTTNMLLNILQTRCSLRLLLPIAAAFGTVISPFGQRRVPITLEIVVMHEYEGDYV